MSTRLFDRLVAGWWAKLPPEISIALGGVGLSIGLVQVGRHFGGPLLLEWALVLVSGGAMLFSGVRRRREAR